MAKKIKFPLEMRDGIQARTLEELQEHFDIEKAMGYLIDGKLCTWLEDRYYISEAESIKGIDVYAADAKEKLCAVLGVELEVDAEVDVNEIEHRKERLAKLKQFTDDEGIWEKVDQVAFNQEELADLLDEESHEIYLCGDNMTIPLAVHNVKYIGVKRWNVVLNGEGGNQYCREHKIVLENLKYESSGLEEGEEKYMAYELREALELLLPEAENGMGRAMWILYMIYTDGGCRLETDAQKAKEWCLRGEKAGDPLANLYRGVFYSENEDEKKTICREVKNKVQQMADGGDALAQHALAISYINETDEPCNYEKAVEYFQKSSSAGYWRSDYLLGDIYIYGEGVEQDDKKAVEYYKRAADAGYVYALYDLGLLYQCGKEVDEDFSKADEYFQKASEQYSLGMKKRWREELVQKLNEFTQYNCSDMWYKAQRATGCSYTDLWDNTYSSESACRSAMETRIYNCIQWLQDTWILSDSNNEKYKRLKDVEEVYDKRLEEIISAIAEYCPKIAGKGILGSFLEEEIDELENLPTISEIIENVVRNGNYASYSSYEAVACIECADFGLNDSNIFRQAKYRVTGWKEKTISEQEKRKCQEFSENLFRKLKSTYIKCIEKCIEKIH